jgi:hypothetical protein
MTNEEGHEETGPPTGKESEHWAGSVVVFASMTTGAFGSTLTLKKKSTLRSTNLGSTTPASRGCVWQNSVSSSRKERVEVTITFLTLGLFRSFFLMIMDNVGGLLVPQYHSD